MNTAARIARIKKIQVTVFSFLATLNLYGNLFPEDASNINGKTYDYLIVGGGSAGVVLAARLVEANCSVLIIEAGENPDLESRYPRAVTAIKGSRMDWNFTSEGGPKGNCYQKNAFLPSGKVLGGSGATNYMIYGRGYYSEYDKISKIAKDSSWNFDNMLKYYKKSEKLEDNNVIKSPYGKYHGTEGKIGVTKENRPTCQVYLKGFKQAGEPVEVDNIGAGITGYSTALYRILDGYRTEGAFAYLTPLKNNPNLQITRNSLATKIIFDKNKNAVGVKFVKDGKKFTAKANKEVLLCAGPIKSPQLLMLSGIGPKKELKKMKIEVLSDLPVGQNLQNTVGSLLVFKTNRSANPEPRNIHYFPTELMVGHSSLNKSSRKPDYTTLNHIMKDSKFFSSFCGYTVGLKNSICDKLNSLAGKNEILATVLVNPTPKSRGEVKLNSTDPFDQPKIITGYFSNDEDLEEVVSYIMDYVKIEKSPHFKSFGLQFLDGTEKCNKYKLKSKEYWKCYVLCMMTNLSNECGTCAMGSVVDSKLKVMGVNRLRVVDASVIPIAIGSQVYDLVVSTAEKTADILNKM